MKVGLTFDLRDYYLKKGYSLEETAEFDRKETINAIEDALKSLGFEVEKIGNFEALVKFLLRGRKWDIVFNICEGLYGYGRESLVPAILDQYKIPYVFSDPLTLAISLKKDVAKKILKHYNIKTPDFAVIQNLDDIKSININYPLFAKPIAEGTGKGIDSKSKITNFNELKEVCSYLLKKYNQPVLVERYLSGREFTVGIIGCQSSSYAIGAIEVITKGEKDNIYSYENKEYCEEKVIYVDVKGELFEKCAKIALKAWQAIDGKDAGRVDLREDENGELNVLEINPLAGLHPEHSDLPIIAKFNNISYLDLIRQIMYSALKRYSLKINF